MNHLVFSLMMILFAATLPRSQTEKIYETYGPGYDVKYIYDNRQWIRRFKSDQSNPVEDPLFIGSFNIQTLSKKKLSNVDIMMTIEKVIHRYDLILILELMTNDRQQMNKFLFKVNKFAPEGVVYKMLVSNDSSVNEFCAIFYREDKLRVLKWESYSDSRNFYRSPFFVLFDSPTLRDMKQFGVVGFHVKPTNAVKEINALAQVYDYMKGKYKVEDILLMGDFNADCIYVKEHEWVNIALWTRPEFTWAIDQNIDTTTNYRKCALDRFVYAGENMNEGVIQSTAKAFDFGAEFDLSLDEVRAVSDHWPIELKIRGKVSTEVEKYLSSNACFNIHNEKATNVSKEDISKASKATQFSATSVPYGFRLKNETKYFEHMLQAVKKLGQVLPTVVTREQVGAVMYKSKNGALEDLSSYADEPSVRYIIELLITGQRSEIAICKTTTIN